MDVRQELRRISVQPFVAVLALVVTLLLGAAGGYVAAGLTARSHQVSVTAPATTTFVAEAVQHAANERAPKLPGIGAQVQQHSAQERAEAGR